MLSVVAALITATLAISTTGASGAPVDRGTVIDSSPGVIYAAPTNRSFWIRKSRLGFAGKPGTSPAPAKKFGSISGGGTSAPAIRVSSDKDSGPGSLRAALESPGGAWIYVDSPLTIRLESRIRLGGGNKTLIASSPRGERLLTLLDHGIVIREVANVMISGVTVVDADGDPFELRSSAVVHLHNVDAFGFTDGFDIREGSTDITVSESIIHVGTKGMLIGASDTPFSAFVPGNGYMSDLWTRVTLSDVVFDGQKRCPLVRHAEMVEMFNVTIEDGPAYPIEVSWGAHVRMVSGQFIRGAKTKIAGTDRPPSRPGGFLYISPDVDTDGLTAVQNWPQGANYPPKPFAPYGEQVITE